MIFAKIDPLYLKPAKDKTRQWLLLRQRFARSLELRFCSNFRIRRRLVSIDEQRLNIFRVNKYSRASWITEP